ncbi:MAG: four helix bundle protein [Chitinophagaceae bacterium]
MAKAERFEDLEIWQDARILAKKMFDITHQANFPKDFGYISQINNATGSVMDNIAEGFERNGRKEFLQFLSIAKGSAGEVRSQLHRGIDRLYFTPEVYNELMEEVIKISKRLSVFISTLNQSIYTGTKFKNRA